MKLRSTTLNQKALINHFGISRKMAMIIDDLVQGHNLSMKSMLIFIRPDGSVKYDVWREPTLIYKREATYGLHITWTLDNCEKEGPSIALPWRLLRKGSPDLGHVVYMINLRSFVAMLASNKMGEYAFASKETRDKIQNKEILEAKIGQRVAAYIGKTSQGSANRLKQHISSAMNGSKTNLHKRIAGSEKYSAMIPVMVVIDSADSSESAYDLEEVYIKESAHAHDQVHILNMMLSRDALADLIKDFPEYKRSVITDEMAEEILAEKRLKSSLNWDDPDYAEAVICNNENNFNASDVRLIRMLHSLGDSVACIATSMKIDKKRIQDLVSGATYRRIT